MMTLARRFAGLVLALLLLVVAGAAAQETSPESLTDRLARWESDAKQIKRDLEFEDLSLEDIARMRGVLESQLRDFPAARQEATAALKPLQDQRAALGDPPGDPSTEAPQIALERKRLDEEISRLEARVKQVDQAIARAEGLLTRLTELRRTLFTDRLMTRGPSLFDPGMVETALQALWRKANIVWLETSTRLSGMEQTPGRIAGLIVAAVLVTGLALVLRRLRNRVVRRMARRVTAEMPRSRRVAAGALIALARLVLPALAVGLVIGALLVSGLFGGQGTMLLTAIAKGFAVVIGAYALGGAFFAPHAPLLRLSVVGETDAACAHRWLIVLAGVVGLDRALVQGGQEMGVAVEGLALLNTGVLVLGGLTLWKFLLHLRTPVPEPAPAADPGAEIAPAEEEDDPDAPRQRGSFGRSLALAVRIVGWVSALAAPALSLAGFYVAARYAFFPVVFSGALIGGFVLLYHLVRTLVDHFAGDGGEGGLDRLRLIPIGVGFLLFCAALPVLALIWGAEINDLSLVWRVFIAGFQMGDIRVSPVEFIVFAVVMVVGIVLNRRLKLVLRRNVLPYTGLDAGGRDAVAAGAGYLGIVVVALVAVSSAGIDLSSLAIVAGALSVGIGFGLQNIVNNFVSGIILLIERPIKAGDWIELPAGMGYVKTINVRSTEVETFDRSSLFVPNSQLISENVINWTHSNLHGRVIVPIRVAHGSDARQVERILLEVARAHPLMLRRPAPYVLLRGFGADAMSFEIRGILRDVNWVLNVQSDINFEILRRFDEAGIEIPFSQTDIHLRNAEGIVEALSGRRAETTPPAPAPEPVPAAAPTPAVPRRHAAPAGDSDGGPGDAR